MKLSHTALILALVLIALAAAENTTIWENTTYLDFSQGTLQNTILFSDGTIHSGSRVNSIQTQELTLWSFATSESGDLYAGTGVKGAVYRFKDDNLEKYCDTGELIVTALAVQGEDIYAGTIPDGKIFRIKDKKATLAVQLPSKYIWSMKFCRQKLYVGTGPDGKLYEVDVNANRFQIVADTPEKHLLSIATDKDDIYVGSAPSAVLYRLAPNGKVSALVDLPENEIRALAAKDGKIYIGANKTEKFDNARMVQTLVKKVEQQSKGKALDRKKLIEDMLSGTLYLYDDKKGWEKQLEVSKDFITSIALLEKDVLFSTGLKGKLYQVHDKNIHSVVHEIEGNQIMDMVVANGKLKFFGAGDTGKFYRVEPEFKPDEARYLSKVHDGETFTHWSTLYWEKQGKMSVQTRSGNTEKPDKFWSAWSSLCPSSYPYIKISSPPGRYFQYRVIWHEPSAVLKSVQVLYSRTNRSAEISKFELALPSKNPRSLYREKPINPIKITWKAKDPDDETLRYHLWYKHTQSNYWHEISAHKILTTTSYKWDTTHIADGYYLVKLVASDELENTTPTQTEKITRPILIDNHPPSITAHIEKNEISGTVIDSFSFITQIGYRVNEEEWVLIPASDGICDHMQESFRFDLPAFSQESYTLQLKAMDAAGNTGYVFCTVQGSEK